jgi:hypothetical protein
MIGKARKEGKKWGREVEKKEMKRLVISGIHYLREGRGSRLKIMGMAKLWQDETGEKGIIDLFIEPLPPAFL